MKLIILKIKKTYDKSYVSKLPCLDVLIYFAIKYFIYRQSGKTIYSEDFIYTSSDFSKRVQICVIASSPHFSIYRNTRRNFHVVVEIRKKRTNSKLPRFRIRCI